MENNNQEAEPSPAPSLSTRGQGRLNNAQLQQQVEQLTALVLQLQAQQHAPPLDSAPSSLGTPAPVVAHQVNRLEPPKPDTFDGRQVETFVFSMENAFNYYQVEESNRITTAANYFRHAALTWYRYVCTIHDVSQMRWSEFKQLMLKQFRLSNDEKIIRNKLNSLKQLTSVSKYNEIFNSLIIQLPTVDELTKLDMYTRNLKTNIQIQVALKEPSTLEEAQQIALRIDSILGDVRENRHQPPHHKQKNSDHSKHKKSFATKAGQQNHSNNQKPDWKPKRYTNWNNNYNNDSVKRDRQNSDRTNNNWQRSSSTFNHQSNGKDNRFINNRVNNVSTNKKQKNTPSLTGVCESNDEILYDEGEELNTIVCNVNGTAKDNEPQSDQLIVIHGTIFNKSPVIVKILVDCGATCNFIAQSVVDRYKLKTIPLSSINSIQLANGSTQRCTDCTEISVALNGRKYPIQFRVMEIASYDMILGMPFLNENKARIDFKTKRLTIPKQVKDDSCAPKLISAKQMETTLKHHDFNQVYLLQMVPSEPEQNQLNGLVQLNSVMNGVDPIKNPGLNKLLQEFQDIFPTELPSGLPPERDVKHNIQLISDHTPPCKPPYRMAPAELEELRIQLDDLLDKGFIEPAVSPYGSPVLFVKKKDGSRRLCVDFRALNKLTIRNRYPIPFIDDLFDALVNAKFFSKMDLNSGYHQIRIQPADRMKTAFRTRYGHFQWRVLPFGLTNAVETFQTLMQSVFKDCLDRFVIVYLDDILVYSKTAKEHLEHLRHVLGLLRDHYLYAKLTKCEFMVQTIDFLGHRISNNQLMTDPEKIVAIKNWPTPTNVKQIQSWLGITGYYRRFIRSYGEIALPLTKLIHKTATFQWTMDQQKSFEALKNALTTQPVLLLPDLSKTFTLTTDASKHSVGAVLQQDNGHGLQPVAYMSKKLNEHELNYPTHEQELLAIVVALKKWRHYLLGQHFNIQTDNRSLKFLQTQPTLSSRQARWLDVISEYDFDITHVKGKLNQAADSLSRIETNNISAVTVDDPLLSDIKEAYTSDPYCQPIIDHVKQRAGTKQHCDYQLVNGLLYNKDNVLLIPSAQPIIRRLLFELHDSQMNAHQGINRTINNAKQLFYWKTLTADITNYIKSCPICQQDKPSQQRPGGLLQPIKSPPIKWHTISMDFITQLPMSVNKHDAILVVVDKFTKMAHFIPTTTSVTAPEAAKLIFDNVVRLHGLPKEIISDRDSRFTSTFWQSLFSFLNTKLKLSTSFHPQSDGQTENMNRYLEQALRHYVDINQKDWDQYLTSIEIAHNNTVHTTTKFSPFFLNYGYQPSFPLALINSIKSCNNAAAQGVLSTMDSTMKEAVKNIEAAQQRQQLYADKSRREVEFNVGDQVLLSTKNLKKLLPDQAHKLNKQFIGPFNIIKVVSPVAYQLKLPLNIKVHDVFHVSLLKPFIINEKFGERVEPKPDAIEYTEDDVPVYEVERILDKRTRRLKNKTKVQYLVKWKGWPDYESTWEPYENLQHTAEEAIRDFEASRRF